MVPRIIHQVWIGPHEPPMHWLDGWRLPGWDYMLWRDADVDKLQFSNRRLYDAYLRDQRWCGAVNVARVEILVQHGGVYIDADTEMINPIDSAPWLESESFTLQAPTPGRLANGVMGGHPRAKPLLSYRHALRLVRPFHRKMIHPSWKRSGSGLIGRVHRHWPFTLIPPGAFYFQDLDGQPVLHDGVRYGRHHGGTTHGMFPPVS